MFVSCKKERVAAAPCYLLLAKAVSCAVSVVKGGSCSRRSCYKPCTEISVCVATRVAANGLWWQINLLPFYVCKNDTGTSEK